MKHMKPQTFDGKRDALKVITWLYKLDVYFRLLQVTNAQLLLDEQTKISFASTLLTGNASNWWYMKVMSQAIPQTWNDFTQSVRNEYIPFDHVRRVRDKLRNLVQKTSVSSYLNEFRNLVLTIPDMSDGEKLDKFCAGLKPIVRLEVLKAGPANVDAAARIALNVDSAMFGAGMFNSVQQYSQPQPMDIGNVEGNFAKGGRPQRGNGKWQEQRRKDIENNACFKCHKVNCRPYKCSPRKVQTTNTETEKQPGLRQSEN